MIKRLAKNNFFFFELVAIIAATMTMATTTMVIAITWVCFLTLIYSNGVLADVCDSNDLECQKVKAMEEVGIKPLATKEPEKTPDANTKDANNGSQPYEFPPLSASHRTVINPGLNIAPANQDQEINKAIDEVNRTANNEAKRKASTTPEPNIDVPQLPAPTLKTLKHLPLPEVGSGSVASAIDIPLSEQKAQSLYVGGNTGVTAPSVQPALTTIYR